ncbi:alpha/beta-hydrolase [Pseudovirgaria hyperparasitica]|uniref:Alpha/beta-hydrolase n=1 Tax=Pseudovirgaria hyperparasitica TaxID=470096 RepID=A0A6A6WGS2_9PEZI|nr:alpha/beta-hydrolase [Pseudovirgaria hyperparasitica]KAF2760351.1 alpha/beta-hydrolase [Pseudovirgaria hyperparasitica]
MALITSQPFKGIYVLLALAFELSRFPLFVVSYLIPNLRPNAKWTFRQAIGIKIVRLFLYHAGAVEMNVPLPLAPGAEGKQFLTVEPASEKYYTGPLRVGNVSPIKIGGTWYPHAPTKAELKGKDVGLHFHGGAFVIGDGRKRDAGFAGATLNKHAKLPFVFAPQYRLSGAPTNGKFPAAFQDAVTTYLYPLHDLEVPASRIIISGDSAGGNLCLALLRYIAQFGKEVDIPAPGASLLFSPWVEPHGSYDQARTRMAPNYATDYIHSSFGAWGISKYIPDSMKSPSAKFAEYISPLGNPFKSTVPIWITVGGSEVLLGDDTQLYEELKKEGNEVALDIQENAPHDYILVGPIVGFEFAARKSSQAARSFINKKRKL